VVVAAQGVELAQAGGVQGDVQLVHGAHLG
jgi:hypothetical protein